MKYTRLVAVLATAGMAATAVALAAPANAWPGTYLVNSEFGNSYLSGATNLDASGGVVNISPTLDAECNTEVSPVNLHNTLISSSAVTAKLPVAKCAVDGFGDSYAAQHLASVSLLAGQIRVTAVDSQCSASGGTGSVGSTVGTLNGQPLSRGTGQVIKIPGLATVTINKNIELPGFMETIAVYVNVLPVFVGTHQVTPGQTIIVGACFVASET